MGHRELFLTSLFVIAVACRDNLWDRLLRQDEVKPLEYNLFQDSISGAEKEYLRPNKAHSCLLA